MSRLIFSLLPRTTDGGEFSSPRRRELGQFRFMRMVPSRVRWSCYKRRSTEYRTKRRGKTTDCAQERPGCGGDAVKDREYFLYSMGSRCGTTPIGMTNKHLPACCAT